MTTETKPTYRDPWDDPAEIEKLRAMGVNVPAEVAGQTSLFSPPADEAVTGSKPAVDETPGKPAETSPPEPVPGLTIDGSPVVRDTVPFGAVLDMMGVPKDVQQAMASAGGVVTSEAAPLVGEAPSDYVAGPDHVDQINAIYAQAAKDGRQPMAPTVPAEVTAIANVPMADLGAEEVVRALEAMADAPAAKLPWRITDVGGLEWFLRKVAGMKADLDTLKANAEEQQKIVGNRIKTFEQAFKPQAEDFLADEIDRLGGKKQSINTLAGTVGFQYRGKDGEFEVSDPAVLLAWALEKEPALVATEEVEEWDVEELLAHARATKPEMIRKLPVASVPAAAAVAHYQTSGEVPPGCRLTERQRVMYVRAVKADDAKAKPAVPAVAAGTTFKTQVAGANFRRFDWAEVAKGQPVELRREPGNPKDPSAIQVLHPTQGQIGYVPAKDGTAARLAPLMDMGAVVTAVVTLADAGMGHISLEVNVGEEKG